MQNVVINVNSRLEPATGWFSCYFVQTLFLRVTLARPEVGRCRLTFRPHGNVRIFEEAQLLRTSHLKQENPAFQQPFFWAISVVCESAETYCCIGATGSKRQGGACVSESSRRAITPQRSAFKHTGEVGFTPAATDTTADLQQPGQTADVWSMSDFGLHQIRKSDSANQFSRQHLASYHMLSYKFHSKR